MGRPGSSFRTTSTTSPSAPSNRRRATIRWTSSRANRAISAKPHPANATIISPVFTTSPEQGEAYDRLERHRDPSHTRALQMAELDSLFAGLKDVRRAFYKYPVTVDDLLSRSFPDPGGAEAFRRTVESDVGVNRLGIDATREGGLGFAFPVVIVSGVKPRG